MRSAVAAVPAVSPRGSPAGTSWVSSARPVICVRVRTRSSRCSVRTRSAAMTTRGRRRGQGAGIGFSLLDQVCRLRRGGQTNFGLSRPLPGHSRRQLRSGHRPIAGQPEGGRCFPSDPGHSLEDHGCDPDLTLVAVLIGGSLLGIIGALVAIPVAAAARLLLQEIAFRRLDDS